MPPRLRTFRRHSPSERVATLLLRRQPLLWPSLPYINQHATSFSTTAANRFAAGREPTHYEVLNVPVTATAAEIKKSDSPFPCFLSLVTNAMRIHADFLPMSRKRQFYALSLAHHPDRNQSDPNASARFATISSAYQVLGNGAQRARYDRDNGIHVNQNTHSTASPGQHPMGSHGSHKGSYMGSRPASGLSARRGPFRGPPPSFYAHGGYGAKGARPGPQDASSSSGGDGTHTMGGTGGPQPTEEDPTSFIHHNPVPHFNARGHYRTQTAEDVRRRQRRSRERRAVDPDIAGAAAVGDGGSLVARFIVVSGILLGAAALGGLFHNRPENTPTARRIKSSRKKDD